MKTAVFAVVYLWAAVQGVFVWDKLCWHPDASWLYATLPTWLSAAVGALVLGALWLLDRSLDGIVDFTEGDDEDGR